jgi:ribosomal protein S16
LRTRNFGEKHDGKGERVPNRSVTSVAISVTFCSPDALTFEVVGRGTRGDNRHQASMQADEAKRWAKPGAEPSHCVETAMRLLLNREPKESVLNAFDMRAVRRYFP